MRISDWSSDVCSSDLDDARRAPVAAHGAAQGAWPRRFRLLHQSRQPQGRRAGGEPARRAALSLEVAAPPDPHRGAGVAGRGRSEEHTSELQSLMRNSYAVFCLKKKKNKYRISHYANP